MTATVTPGAQALAHRRWLADQSDWIAAHMPVADLARRARRAYIDRQAIRNLARAAQTAHSVVELSDYVRLRTGRSGLWRRDGFGVALLNELERLRSRTTPEQGDALVNHLDLCRLFVEQLAVAYAFTIAVDVSAPRTPTPNARPAASAASTVPNSPRPVGTAASPNQPNRARAQEPAARSRRATNVAPVPELEGVETSVEVGVQESGAPNLGTSDFDEQLVAAPEVMALEEVSPMPGEVEAAADVPPGDQQSGEAPVEE